MLDDHAASLLRGRRVLVVEDDFFQAQDLAEWLAERGAEVMGPVPSVEDGLGLLLGGALPHLAVLDVRLGGDTVFPLVEALRARDIPVAFASASPSWSLPEPYDGLPHCEKPLDARELVRALAALRGAW